MFPWPEIDAKYMFIGWRATTFFFQHIKPTGGDFGARLAKHVLLQKILIMIHAPSVTLLQGMLLEQRSGHDTPKSSFFSFVFTNVDGRRTYTACLTFYEPMAPSAAR